MKTVHCQDCNQKMSNDEVALNLKLLGKYIGKFRCHRCLSKTLGCEEEKLVQITDFLKNSGCILFQNSYTGSK